MLRGLGDWIRRLWSALRFRDAVALTAFPLAVLALLLVTSARDYLRAKQFDDWWSRGQGVGGAFSARLHGLASLPQSLGLRNTFAPGQDDAGVIRLDLPARRWDSLEVEPDGVWAPWLEGELRYGSTTVPVRLRKRGDNSIHWLTDKRSLTIRTPRDEFYKGFRSFALSAKDVLPSYLANRLASEFGLLVPVTEIVPVYVNNRFHGVYRFLETVDESFLRPFDRMPGNVFRGDAAERGEYRKGGPRNLFENPLLWDRPAANDRWTGAGPGQLALLLGDLAGGGFSDHQRLMARFDRAEYARLFAYLLLVGDPFHMDGVHNQLLYEDLSTQWLHPIPWDIRVRDLGKPEIPLNDLFRELLRDPGLPDAVMREVARSLRDDRFLTLADSLLRAAEGRYSNYLRYDRLRVGLVPPIGEVAEIRATLGGNARLLRSWMDDDAVAVAAARAGNAVVLDLETRGLVGTDLTALRLTGPASGAVELRLDTNLNGVLDDADATIPVRRDSGPDGIRIGLTVPVPLYAGWDLEQRGIRAGHMPYRLFVLGVPQGSDVEPELVNRVTGKPAKRAAWAGGTRIREGTAWHPWRFQAPAPRRVSLSGNVRLAETLKIPEGDTLVIAPGSVLRLGPDVSIISRGRVFAEGTASRPIRVLAAQAKLPWGTFALQGHGADSSRFGHIEFAEGGGALVDRIEYTGMVNVHRADGVIFEHAIFRDNVRSDDTFHALHAIGIVIRDSRFIRANSDAVDFDISNGEIVRNVFEASGGDAIDLMTSAPRIIGNQISGSGDKGISIGEASRPFVFNNTIDHCGIGVEVKDRSAPVLLNNRLVANHIGLRERRKNWRYGSGGWGTIVLTEFADNAQPWVRDAFSRVTLASVTGLDSIGGRRAAPAVDLGWLYRMFGVKPPESMAKPGLVDRASTVVSVPPLEEQSFRDDFGAVADGWRADAGLGRLEKRHDALVFEAKRGSGSAARVVHWSLPSGGTLVLEVAGRDLAGARVEVLGPGPTVVRTFQVSSDPAASWFVTVPLPPGSYDGLKLQVVPIPGLRQIDRASGLTVLGGGRLDLRTVRVFPTSGAL